MNVKNSEKGSRKAMMSLSDSTKRRFIDDSGHKIFIHNWISPVYPDYKEFWDRNFLSKLPLSENQCKVMSKFWPKGGPHWDGLAISDSGEILLIEAKAYIGEFAHTYCRAKSPSSRKLINNSLLETAEYLETTVTPKWTDGYYQTANRLAHLYKLNTLSGVSARLVYIFFSNTETSKKNETPELWRKAFKEAEIDSLQLPPVNKLSDKISILFIDANEL